MKPIDPTDTNPAHPGTPITEREKWWKAEVERLTKERDTWKWAVDAKDKQLGEFLEHEDRLKTGLEKAQACCVALAERVWNSRWVSDDPDYQEAVGMAAEIRSGNSTCGTALLEELKELRDDSRVLENYHKAWDKYIQKGEHSLPEAIDNRMRELEELRSFKAKHES